ncbi:UDP-glucuronosyltransferase 2B7 [Anoplophora glabripennis]|nr:UDP-glucuronosyltransferase 2B7 [Anoplophora glabripennis]
MMCILPLIVLFTWPCHGANILAILPSPSYSHQIAYTHIWKELSLRGHKVTLITTDPVKDPKLTNLTEIDMKSTYELMGKLSNISKSAFTMWNVYRTVQNFLNSVAEAQLSHAEVQSLIHNKSHFDVVLVEFIYVEFLAFAEIYDCPKILFSTFDPYSLIHSLLGNPINPVLYPDMGATFYGSLNFKERVTSSLFTLYSLYYFYYESYYQKSEIIKKYFSISRTAHELVSDVDMLFLNVNPILQPIRALGPSTIMIGGNRGVIDSTPLPKDLANFLDNAKDGFVYFSLGSNVKSKDLLTETREAIIEAFRELPFKVLWKFEADELPNKPDNVKIIKWAPQQAVLSHPNIKAFVTQGGLQSFEEALYCEVPFVVIPFFGDQEQNAKVIENKGMGVVINKKFSVGKIELKNAILEVTKNTKYHDAVKRVKQWVVDSPMTGLEKAVWWTEYVIRNKGAKHLRNPAADIPLYQYFLVDVIGFLVLAISATFLLLFLFIRTICRLVVSKYVNKISKKKSA